MPVDQEEVGPAVICEIDKSIAPADIAAGGVRNAGSGGNLGEVHVAVVAIESGVFVVEMGDEERHASGVQIVAECDAHVGLRRRRWR